MPSTLLFDHNFSSFYQIFLLLRLILLANLLTVHYDFDCHSSPSSRLVSADNQSTLSFLCAPKTLVIKWKAFFNEENLRHQYPTLSLFLAHLFLVFILLLQRFHLARVSGQWAQWRAPKWTLCLRQLGSEKEDTMSLSMMTTLVEDAHPGSIADLLCSKEVYQVCTLTRIGIAIDDHWRFSLPLIEAELCSSSTSVGHWRAALHLVSSFKKGNAYWSIQLASKWHFDRFQ